MSFATWPKVLALLLGTLPFASDLDAQVYVPGDYSTPQAALDASPAGSTIIVSGGTWDPLLIHTPVTLIGSPRATFEASYGDQIRYNLSAPAIFLDGPGSGTVKLVNIATSPSFERFQSAGGGASNVSPGITGDGFAGLRVIDSQVLGVEWSRAGLSGLASGEAGILVDIPFLWVQDSYIQGSRTTNGFDLNSWASSTSPGIQANDVVIINSTVVGGGYDSAILSPLVGCPDAPGGPAVVASTLFHSGSVLQAGRPGTFSDPFTSPASYCTSTQGPALNIAGATNSSPYMLRAMGPLRIGVPYTLIWSLPPPSDYGLIIASLGLTRGQNTVSGLRFLDPTRVALVRPTAPVGGSTGVMTFNVPLDPGLLGVETGFQAFGFERGGLGAPMTSVVGP